MTTGFGIDFGTTNSVVSSYRTEDGVPHNYLERGQPLPSVVWYSDTITVGRVAKEHINSFAHVPGNTFVRSIKGKLGSKLADIVLGEAKYPYEVAADIFRHLKQMAAEGGADVGEIVLTVPVNFDGKHRADLRKAAELAGIHVRTFIHEPLAAVVGYLYGRNQAGSINSLQGKYVLVFDWGGGTLDITLVRVDSSGLEQQSVGGIKGIAGDRFDEVLQQLIIQKFLERNRISPEGFVVDARHRDRLAVEAEQAKIDLSKEEMVTVTLEQLVQRKDGSDLDLHERIMRVEFEGQIVGDVSRAMAELERVLAVAKVPAEQVALVLMTGGTCQIPLVKEMLSDQFGSRIVDITGSSTIIAEGAAIAAASNLQPHLAKSIQVEQSDGSFYTVFEAGTKAISRHLDKEVLFLCTDNREGEARLIVQEASAEDERETELVLNIPLKTNAPMKYPERVEVHFQMNADLVLEVRAWGSIRQAVKAGSLPRLCFGLQFNEQESL